MSKQNIFFDRERFEKVQAWCNANGVVPQISKLRVSQQLVNGQGLYRFDIKKEQANTLIGEVGLDRNDLFIPFAIGAMLQIDGKEATGKTPLLSYPVKASAAADGFMTDDIEALYNGTMTIIMDQTEVNASFPMELFKHVPQTQPCVLLDSSNAAKSTGLVAEYDIQDVLVPLAPAYYFQGTVDTKLSVTFNGNGSDFSVASAATPTTADATKAARIVLYMSGVLVKGAAEKAKANPLKM